MGPKGHPIIARYLFDSSCRENYTLIGAIDIKGWVKEACEVVWAKKNDRDTEPTRGTVDADRFVSYVEETLVPVLGRYDEQESRSVVVMDNASIHKDVRITALIEGAGARIIWTAPYSPWLNPIEHCFAFYKRRLRRLKDVSDAMTKHLMALDCLDDQTMINLYKGIECVVGIEQFEMQREIEEQNKLVVILLLLFVLLG